MSIFWQMSQELKDIDIGRVARQARARTDATLLRQQKLERQVEKLLLASAAMWSLIVEKTHLTEDDLAARMRELDLRDGRRDERLPREARTSEATCGACGRKQPTCRPWCLYCGAELESSPFHDLFSDRAGPGN